MSGYTKRSRDSDTTVCQRTTRHSTLLGRCNAPRDAAKKLSAGVAFLMKKNKVSVVEGTASLVRRDVRARKYA